MDAIGKIKKAYQQDKRVRQEAQQKNQFGLMPFRQFIGKKYKLQEAVVADDIQDSMMATLPLNAPQSDLDYVANVIRNMSKAGGVVVTAILVA